jgi:LysR family transcriptional regulator, hydrogen peroxide-inducible genes activator
VPTLRQLDYLVAIAETLHFRRAAERMNATQSTLSSQLKALEERLGIQLVERTNAKVILTPAGHDVVAIARRMLRDAKEIRDIAKVRGRLFSGVLRLGVPPTIGPSLLPRAIPVIREKYPALKLYIREEPPSDLTRALEDGAYDAVITVMPVIIESLIAVPLFCEPLYLAISNEHPLAAKTILCVGDLKGLDVLTLKKGHQLHALVHALCERTGAVLRDDYEGTSLDTLREMVASGLGCAFLPALYVRSRLACDGSIALRTVSDCSLTRMVCLAWRRSSPLAENYQALAQIIKNVVETDWPETRLPTAVSEVRGYALDPPLYPL